MAARDNSKPILSDVGQRFVAAASSDHLVCQSIVICYLLESKTKNLQAPGVPGGGISVKGEKLET